MRKILSFLVLALGLCTGAAAAPYDLYVSQENASGIGSWLRYIAPLSPAPNTSGLLIYNGTTTLPQMAYIGSGLTWNGTTLSATASAQVNSDWAAVSGVEQVLNKPVFNFSLPAARTLAVSTDYQATDPTKAAVIYPSYACQNATQVLTSSACTIQVRMGASALTCSTGTIYYTQSLAVNLGVLITQNSTNPVPIFLPIGAHFILCPVAGTFTTTTVEQTAGI